MSADHHLDPGILLGKYEDHSLEFKGAAAIARPERIAREVVGMLNAAGGAIWIGVAEHDGVATRLEDVPEHIRRIGSLQDHLLDCIEPPPRNADVTCTPVTKAGTTVVHVQVAAGNSERRPFAHVLDHRWRFYVRVGEKLRDMGRDEVRKAFAEAATARQKHETGSDLALGAARKELAARRHHFLQHEAAGMWIGMSTSPALTVPTGAEAVQALLRDPKLTGNRDAGWNFANPYIAPRIDEGGVSSKLKGDFRCRIGDSGTLDLFIARDDLHWQHEGELYGFVVLEHPVALCRLMKKLLADYGDDSERTVIADLAIKGIEGWRLRPHSPDAAGHRFREPALLEDRDDIFFRAPAEVDAAEVLARPDGLGLRLARQVYRAFGYGDEKLPREADLSLEELRLA